MNIASTYAVETPEGSEYLALLEVWEASVRATHHFLQQGDIEIFKHLIQHEFFNAVNLNCVRVENQIAGFLGTSENKIEMLFVHPAYHGRGIGKQLLRYAVNDLQKRLVDVNEQNEQAVLFYRHFGFEVVDRSEKDGMGKPYPILHLQLQK